MVNISSDVIRGYNDTMILFLLRRAPSYGYEISKDIRELTDEKYIIKLAETQGYWVGNTYYGLVGDTNHNNEYTGFTYSVDASDKISDAAKVSSSEIGGGVGGVTPQSAGTSPISGRYHIGYANLPTVPSYLLVTLSCRGTRRQAYITLG